MKLKDSVVVVTGAGGGGCGRAIAQRFATEGAIVIVSDVNETGGRETVRSIEAAGGRALWHRADVTSKEEVRGLINIAAHVGDFRVLINNASGVFHLDDPLEMWQELVEIDLLGTMFATRFAIDAFRARNAHQNGKDGCSIVNMSSITGLWHGREHASPGYDAVKAAVIRLTTMLASLNQSDGIRVNCLAPGWIAAPQVREYWEPLTPEQRKARHAPSRLLQLDEVAEAVFRLAMDESLFGRVMLWWSEDEPRLIPYCDRGYENTERFVRGRNGRIRALPGGTSLGLLAIREWRRIEGDSGRPSELDDYFVAHGICPKCRGEGVTMVGWSDPVDDSERDAARHLNLEQLPLHDLCSACCGSGKGPITS